MLETFLGVEERMQVLFHLQKSPFAFSGHRKEVASQDFCPVAA